MANSTAWKKVLQDPKAMGWIGLIVVAVLIGLGTLYYGGPRQSPGCAAGGPRRAIRPGQAGTSTSSRSNSGLMARAGHAAGRFGPGPSVSRETFPEIQALLTRRNGSARTRHPRPK